MKPEGSWLNLGTWRYLVRVLAARYPSVFFSLFKKQSHLHVGHCTDVVIEGFARSANTFSVEAFEQLNPAVRVAHHQHVQAQIIRAAKRNIPTIVLIRHPYDAIRSLAIRTPHLPVSLMVWQYVRFYEDIWSLRGSFVLAPFDIVTSDLGSIVATLNDRHQCGFVEFEGDESAVDNVFSIIDKRNAEAFGGEVNAAYVPRPHPLREKAKADMHWNTETVLWRRAVNVFERYMALH